MKQGGFKPPFFFEENVIIRINEQKFINKENNGSVVAIGLFNPEYSKVGTMTLEGAKQTQEYRRSYNKEMHEICKEIRFLLIEQKIHVALKRRLKRISEQELRATFEKIKRCRVAPHSNTTLTLPENYTLPYML